MFNNSTHAKYWMFKNDAALAKIREETNARYVESHSHRKMETMSGDKKDLPFLNAKEELEVLRYYEMKLMEFCNQFEPPMPPDVIGTATHYFKRFYLKNSVMDYHPKEILVTAVYLATKVEEFNLSISQFVANVQGNKELATKIILNNELLLLMELDFQLTVHNIFRPIQGLLIDIKTRCNSVINVDSFKPEIVKFYETLFQTDALLIYAPSQIALSAIIHAASKQKQNLDMYVTNDLFKGQGRNSIKNIINIVRQIRIMAKNLPETTKNIRSLTERLEACRNPDNNPDSEVYKRKLEEMVDEDDTFEQPQTKSLRLDTGEQGIKKME